MIFIEEIVLSAEDATSISQDATSTAGTNFIMGDPVSLVGDVIFLVCDTTSLAGDVTFLVGDTVSFAGDITFLVDHLVAFEDIARFFKRDVSCLV